MVSHAFVQYELGGQLFTTETVEQDTHNPVLEYSFLHHVERVSPEVRCGMDDCTRLLACVSCVFPCVRVSLVYEAVPSLNSNWTDLTASPRMAETFRACMYS